jgi:hypothetical protein
VDAAACPSEGRTVNAQVKAPGPGRDFDGCPNACGSIILITAAFGAAWVFTLRLLKNRRAR